MKMTFQKVSWDNPSMFHENMRKLAYNVFKIKYFYEVDQLEKLSRDTVNTNTRSFLVNGYMEAADEATTYLKAIDAFILGDVSSSDKDQHFEWLLSYFSVKEEHLLDCELENEEGFFSWLERREYSQ